MSLADDMADDLDAFLDTDEFAVTATVAGAAVTGIFDRPYDEAEKMAGYKPAFYCRTADVTAVAEGDAATVDGTSYVVAGIQTDRTGMTILVLEEAD